MTDKIRESFNSMLEEVAREKELANKLYECVWRVIRISYYEALIFNQDISSGFEYKMNINNELKNSNTDGLVNNSSVREILLNMMKEDGFECKSSWTDDIFTISVEQINKLIKPQEEPKPEEEPKTRKRKK